MLNKILDDLRRKYYPNIDKPLRMKIKFYEPDLTNIVDDTLEYFAKLVKHYSNLKNFHINIDKILKRIFFMKNNEMEINKERHKQYILPYCNMILNTIDSIITRNELINKINNNVTLNKILEDFNKQHYNIDTLLRKIRNYETELGTIVDVILAHFANLFQCYNNSKNFHINIYEILKRIFFVRNNNIQMDNDRHGAFILPHCDEIIQTINDCIDRNLIQ